MTQTSQQEAPVGAGQLDRLLHFAPTGAPVLSVYFAIPPDNRREPKVALHSFLKPVRELAESHQLAHQERESLRADVDKILALAGRINGMAGRGVAVFTCHQESFYEEVALPRLVRDRATVDSTPYLRPLLSALGDSHRYCAVVVDRKNAWLYGFYMGLLEDEEKAQGQSVRNPNFAGWYGLNEYSARNKAEGLVRRHFRETADKVRRFMSATRAELLIVGGHQEEVADFLPFLAPPLRSAVAGTFTIDTHSVTAAKVRDQCQEIVDAFERDEERRLVDQATERVATGGLGASGLAWCLAAVNEQAAQVLLIDDDQQAPGRVCGTCGWLGTEGDQCPVDGSPTRSTPDVIDEMAAAVVDASGHVKHVLAETELSRLKVAALLRFPVPAPSAAGG